MLGVDVTPPAEDRDLGRRRQAETGAEVGIRIGSGRVDQLGAPGAPRRLAEDAGADENDSGERSQHAHQEAVRIVVACDQLIRPRHGRDRHDAVERGDEVRVETGNVESEVATVEPRELVWEPGPRETIALVEQLEWFEWCA